LPNGWIAASAARAYRVPLVISVHGSDIAMAERHRLLGRLARNAFNAAGAVTAASSDLLRRAVALGADADRAATTHYGVDGELFSPDAADTHVRAQLRVSADTFLVVSVGRLAEVKGFRYLIDAAALLDGTSVVIVGDGELRDDLERRARPTKSVTLAGSLPRARVAAAIAAADAVVVPSVVDGRGRVDGLPNTLLEALACGRAVVATTVGGISEIVEDGDNGLLVPPNDSHAIVEALVRLRDDRVLRNRLGEEARRFAVEQLSWAASAEAFEQAYLRALSHRGGREPAPPDGG
jgi:glycosyltransferase involved in cell wall biosynthesis